MVHRPSHSLRPLEGDIKPWLEVRFGLLGAIVYDGVSALVAILFFKIIDSVAHLFWPDGNSATEVLVAFTHWTTVVLFAAFALLDSLAHIGLKLRNIRDAWRRDE